jgi:hypothetical protein
VELVCPYKWTGASLIAIALIFSLVPIMYEHLSTYQYFWVLGASTYPFDFIDFLKPNTIVNKSSSRRQRWFMIIHCHNYLTLFNSRIKCENWLMLSRQVKAVYIYTLQVGENTITTVIKMRHRSTVDWTVLLPEWMKCTYVYHLKLHQVLVKKFKAAINAPLFC